MGIGEIQRQSILSFVLQIVFTFVGFLSTIYFAHTVGPAVLGAYFLFTAYFSIINMISDGGFGGAVIKHISEEEEPDQYFTAFFFLRSMLASLAIILLLVFRNYFVDLNNSGMFIWIILALLISIPYTSISSGIAGRRKMGLYVIFGFFENMTRVIIQIIAVYFGFGAGGLAGGFVAGMLASVLLEARFFDLHCVHFGWRHIRNLSKFSFWSILTTSGILVYSYADTVLIGYFLDNSYVGLYRVILQLSSVASITTFALQGILWPNICRWKKTGELTLIEGSLSRAFTYSLILAVPIFAGGILLGDRIMYYFYGSVFMKEYPVLIILLLMQIINVFQSFFLIYLGALEQQKEAFRITTIAASVNLILNVMLIPVFGISGAAIATLVAMTFNAILARRMLLKSISIKLEHDSIMNILRASAIMSVFVLTYRIFLPLSSVWYTLIPVIIAGIIYVIIIIRTDRKIYIDLKDIMMQANLSWPN